MQFNVPNLIRSGFSQNHYGHDFDVIGLKCKMLDDKTPPGPQQKGLNIALMVMA